MFSWISLLPSFGLFPQKEIAGLKGMCTLMILAMNYYIVFQRVFLKKKKDSAKEKKYTPKRKAKKNYTTEISTTFG